MELENVLLGLICLHQKVTGYELNRIIQDSTGFLMSASLSHIYPSLRRLHDKGLVEYTNEPIKNRPAKKIYQINPAGEAALHEWLKVPIEESEMDFRPFMLKMAFSPLMSKETILDHIDREISRREHSLLVNDRGNRVEMDFIDRSAIDPAKAEFLWSEIYRVGVESSHLRLEWLRAWREKVQKKLK
jgi:DNA-binding PadR family transcriptional regulator